MYMDANGFTCLNVSKETEDKIKKTVRAFCKVERIHFRPYSRMITDLCKEGFTTLAMDYYEEYDLFLLWDALGSDDLELMDQPVHDVYDRIGKEWYNRVKRSQAETQS